MFRYILFAIAALGIVQAARLAADARPDSPVRPPPVAPAVKPGPHAIAAAGLVEAVRENTRIGVPVAALVKSVNVKVWDKVKAGDTLLTLDDSDLRAALTSQRAAVASSKAGVDAARANRDAAAADRKRTADTLARWKSVTDARAISADDLALRNGDDEVAAARLASAEAGLVRAEADLALAQVKVAEYETLAGRLVIKAPIDGTILQVNTRAGEYARPGDGSPLVLGDIDTLQLRCDIDEQVAPRMKPGLTATAYLKGDSKQPIPLEFVRIEPYVIPKQSLTGSSIERVDTRVLQVIYRFATPAGRTIYVGQQMDVYIDETSSPAAQK